MIVMKKYYASCILEYKETEEWDTFISTENDKITCLETYQNGHQSTGVSGNISWVGL